MPLDPPRVLNSFSEEKENYLGSSENFPNAGVVDLNYTSPTACFACSSARLAWALKYLWRGGGLHGEQTA